MTPNGVIFLSVCQGTALFGDCRLLGEAARRTFVMTAADKTWRKLETCVITNIYMFGTWLHSSL